MSAEVLREAAALMRSRANDAELAAGANDWTFSGIGWCDPHNTVYTVRNEAGVIAEALTEEEAEHIASWHPAVALAVAGWLDQIAGDGHDGDSPGGCADCIPALAVANAYLGRTLPPP